MKKILFLIISAFFCFSHAFSGDTGQTINRLKAEMVSQSGEQKIGTTQELIRQLLAAGKNQEAFGYARGSVEMATKIKKDPIMAIALVGMGDVCAANFDYKNALDYYLQALKIQEKKVEKKSIGDTRTKIGKVYLSLKDYENALAQLSKGLELRIALKDNPGMVESNQLLGQYYLEKKYFGTSEEYYKKALDLALNVEDMQTASGIASHLGTVLNQQNNPEGALVYHRMSLEMNMGLEDADGLVKDYVNIAESQKLQSSWDEVIESANSAIDLGMQSKDTLSLIKAHLMLVTANKNLGKKVEATQFLNKAGELSMAMLPTFGLENLAQDISKMYREFGNIDMAFQWQEKAIDLKEKVSNLARAKSIMELNSKYDSEFKNQDLKNRIAKLESEAEKNRLIYYFLIGIILLGLGLMYSLYQSYNTKKKDNIVLAAKNNEIQQAKVTIELKNQELSHVNQRLNYMNDQLLNEISERESIERNAFAKDKFLATLSHEIRTSLNSIMGLSMNLLDLKPRMDQIDRLYGIQFAANNIVVFINDVLDFSKIEAGKLSIDPRPFNLHKLITVMESKMQDAIKEKGLTMNVNLDSKIPEWLIGDPVRLNQILVNVMNSSLRNTKLGSISINMELMEWKGMDATVKIVIKDTGIGIPKENLELMFFGYNDGNMHTVGEAENLGLSLHVVKRLVDLQNGTIDVVSEEGKGSVFTIVMPFRSGSTGGTGKKSIQAAPIAINVEENLKGKNVLLVEDNKINQLVVSNILKKYLVNVEIANDGAIGSKMALEKDYDLILMDIQMPVMDGYKATTEIRKSNHDTRKNVPIIALTASAFLTEKDKAQMFGMQDHVGKPFSAEELLEKMARCMEGVKTGSIKVNA
jgi:signal transduction histidine kinase/ActR/RegA family two-component response regulator